MNDNQIPVAERAALEVECIVPSPEGLDRHSGEPERAYSIVVDRIERFWEEYLVSSARRLAGGVRKNPRLAATVLLLILPIGTLGWLGRLATQSHDGELVTVLFALTAVHAGLGFFLLFWIGSLVEERRERIEEVLLWRRRDREHQSRLLRLEEEVDLLTAMRDVSRILNDDVHFDSIWGRVLEIVHALVRCEEISIWVVEEGVLEPRVHQKGTVIRFGEKIDREEMDDSGVCDAARHHTVIRVVEDRGLSLVFPLVADAEEVGVLKVVLALDGDFKERQGLVEETEQVVSNFLEHISLAIKTPTLYDMAVIDGLTGLYTKRHLLHELAGMFKILRRHGKRFSFILLDIDHFKSINDTYGHPIGDVVLRGVAGIVRETARDSDSAYRYGGEEICLILPETEVAEAVELAERIRDRIARKSFQGEKGGGPRK